ncbi:hypothetical protein [Desulfuromonas sp. AOP6]|uniref:hypothetical protein n=1 Tax=Desulfuromonas sp. AOP6 TaxID=1566351 RepID=UPI00126CAABC|nr:hypothetical protein [Desulfuromonas sp. AOP6]BCA80966.1 hypothetical protein AOP6_2753 [Desulfuromonas sp. AOP6]
MPISPPAEPFLHQAPMELMELYGRMNALSVRKGFSKILPAVWQCSDESQGIKKALFGYVFDCPVFNLGRVGGLLDPMRLVPASHHGQDLVILGGSHHGIREEDGIGFVERIHGEVAPCCSALYRLLEGYLVIYRRAAASIRLFRGVGGLKVEIPYKYLFRHSQSDEPRIVLHLRRLVDGEALRDSSHGKVYRLHPAFVEKNEVVLAKLGAEPQAIGSLLGAEYFVFSRALDPQSHDIKAMLEVTVFDFLPDIVTSERPHRRLADINTWRQFHRLASYLTDSFDSGERNILVIAGLTLDHSVKRNTFVPQFGFLLPHGRAAEAEYYGPAEINDLLLQQDVLLPRKSFFEYAEVGQDMRPRSAKLT